MANTVYPKAREAFLSGDIDLPSDIIKAVLINTTSGDGAGEFYTYSALDQFLDAVPANARVGTPQTLGSKMVTNGVFDAGDLTFPAVSGYQCEALLVYQDTGVEGTSRLILYVDTATGLPVTPNGGDITITWGTNIFSLGS